MAARASTARPLPGGILSRAIALHRMGYSFRQIGRRLSIRTSALRRAMTTERRRRWEWQP